MTTTSTDVQPLHAEIMVRIQRLSTTSPTAATSTAKAYVDSMLEPVRTSSLDLQNLIDTADQRTTGITRSLKKLNRTMWLLTKLPGFLLNREFAQAWVGRVAGQCRDMVQECAVPVAAFGAVAQGTTADAQESVTPNAQLLEGASKSKALRESPDCQRVLIEGSRALYDNGQLLAAQAATAENLRSNLMVALRQLQEAGNALHATTEVAEATSTSKTDVAEMRRTRRKTELLRARLGLQRSLASLLQGPKGVDA